MAGEHVCLLEFYLLATPKVISGQILPGLLFFYAIAIVFQLYHGGDMMYEMRRRKPKPTLLPTQVIFNLPHHIGMV